LRDFARGKTECLQEFILVAVQLAMLAGGEGWDDRGRLAATEDKTPGIDPYNLS
jgi:hypothetical protein